MTRVNWGGVLIGAAAGLGITAAIAIVLFTGFHLSLAAALERQGRESSYMKLVRASADAIARSHSVDRWIEAEEPGAERIGKLRRAFSDSSALLYLGFGEGSSADDLARNIEKLRQKKEAVETQLAKLRSERDAQWQAVPGWVGTLSGSGPNGVAATSAAERQELNQRIAEETGHLERLERLIEARSHVLPIYKETLESEGLAQEIRSRRDHPVHALLRRMYYEIRS